jgi:hypothetical protein
MQKYVLIVSVCLLFLPVWVGANSIYQEQSAVKVTLLESNENIIRISFEIDDYIKEAVTIDKKDYFRISIPGEVNIMENGMPDLPQISRGLIIPDNAKIQVKVVSCACDKIRLPIAPSRGFISRDINPEDVSYQFSEEYNAREFFPCNTVTLSQPYILRDYRGITLNVYPFIYYPQTQTLSVYSYLLVEIKSVGSDTINVKSANSKNPSRYMSEIYENHFLNYQKSRYTALDDNGRMIVISHADFLSDIQPYVDWKNRKGIPTELYDVAGIGTTPGDIKTFIQSEYDKDDGLVFVQFVGDAAQIPTFTIDRDFCDGSGASDPSYSLLEGDDSYPDIFVGRFSAGTSAEVQTQVERTIHYERDITGGDWLHKGTGMGSAWGEGYGYLGLRDRDVVELLRVMLLEYTYTEVDQLYEWGDPPFYQIPVPVPDYINVINEGRGIVNVQGHGDCECTFVIPPGTPTPGDVFNIDSIYNLTNENMLPFMFLGAPYQGNFQLEPTFPEAWLRATREDKGTPIGAIAVYASSVDLDYASPQAAHHEMVELLVNDNFHSIGGLMYNGACHAIDLYGERGEKTFKSYNIFGDVSLKVRTDTPSEMTVIHDSDIMSGAMSFEVAVAGVKGALCALSRNSGLYGYGYTDDTGYTEITFSQPIAGTTPLDLVITAHNKITYVAQITVGSFLCGDANKDGTVNIFDITFLISYLYSDGPPPDPMESGDVNNDGIINIFDATYLISYLYLDGPEPDCP